MRRCLPFLMGLIATLLATQALAQTPVEVKLIAAIEENRGWCLDVRGPPGRTAPIGGLRSETCKTYTNTWPTEDQAFDKENISQNNEFRMIEYPDKCITLYEPVAGSFVSLETCDGRSAQSMTFDDAGHIISDVMPELCMTIGDRVLPGGGGRPLHIMRDVTFEKCDTKIDIRQTWELRAEWAGPQQTTAERPFTENPNAGSPKSQ